MYSNEGSKTYQSRVAETNTWQRRGAQSRTGGRDGVHSHEQVAEMGRTVTGRTFGS